MRGTGSLLPAHLQRPLQAPEGIGLQLREIQENVELVNIAEGLWWLGVVAPNEFRRAAAARALHRMMGVANAPPGRVLRAMLGEAGFAFIAEYQIEGEEFGQIVSDFRERDWNARHRLDEAIAERANHEDKVREGHKKDRLEEIRVRGLETYLYALRQPRSVSAPTLPPAPPATLIPPTTPPDPANG